MDCRDKPHKAGHDARRVAETRRNCRYFIASGFTGEPTAPVIGIAGATNRNS
jgi:hypothetical protein